jgi:DNA-binding protein Fis
LLRPPRFFYTLGSIVAEVMMNPSYDQVASRSHSEPRLEELAASLVGRLHQFSAQEEIKRAMLREALRHARGNYTHAAALLGVKRQAIQQMVARFDLCEWAGRLRGLALAHPAQSV